MPKNFSELKSFAFNLFYAPKVDRWWLGGLSALGFVAGNAVAGVSAGIKLATVTYLTSMAALSPSKKAWTKYIGKKVSSFPKHLQPGHVLFGLTLGLGSAYVITTHHLQNEGAVLNDFSFDQLKAYKNTFFDGGILGLSLSYCYTMLASFSYVHMKNLANKPKDYAHSTQSLFAKKRIKLEILERNVQEGIPFSANALAKYYFQQDKPDEALGVFFDRLHVKSLDVHKLASPGFYRTLMWKSKQGYSDKEVLLEGIQANIDKESLDVLVDRAYETAKKENDLSTLALVGFYKEKELPREDAIGYWIDFSARMDAQTTGVITAYPFTESSAKITELRLSHKESDPLRSLIVRKEVPAKDQLALHEEYLLTSKAGQEISDEQLSFPLIMFMGVDCNKPYLQMRRHHWPTASEFVQQNPMMLYELDEQIEKQSKKVRDFLAQQDDVQLNKVVYDKDILSQQVRLAQFPELFDEGLVREAIAQVQQGIADGVDTYEPSLDNHPAQWLVHPSEDKFMRLDLANKGLRPRLEDAVNELLYPSEFTSRLYAMSFPELKLGRFARERDVDERDVRWSFLHTLFLRSNRLAIDVWSLPERKQQHTLVQPLLAYACKTYASHKSYFSKSQKKLLDSYTGFQERLASNISKLTS